MEKIEKNGEVAVLFSPGFGAGWSTWNAEHAEALCMDARIVGAFLSGGYASAENVTRSLFPNVYTGGAKDLCVQWLPKGAAFEIEEYDGSESIHVLGTRSYYRA